MLARHINNIMTKTGIVISLTTSDIWGSTYPSLSKNPFVVKVVNPEANMCAS